MIKNEIRTQLVNELYNTTQLFVGRDELVSQIGKVVDKYLARIPSLEDNLTQDAYHNPMVKLMRSEAYNKGCYGCGHSVKHERHWKCSIETELGIDLNYPNAAREKCQYGVAKKRK